MERQKKCVRACVCVCCVDTLAMDEQYVGIGLASLFPDNKKKMPKEQ